MTSTPGGTHVTAQELAAYADGTVEAEARERIEAHLADCAVCRLEVVALARLVRPRRRPWLVAAPALAAAAVLAVLLLPPGGEQVSEPDRFRAVPDSGSIVLLAPGSGAVPWSSGVRLVWHSAGAGADYRVRLAGTDGAEAWNASTTDTAVVVPADVLSPGRTYVWYVDAVLPGGEARSSRAGEFKTTP